MEAKILWMADMVQSVYSLKLILEENAFIYPQSRIPKVDLAWLELQLIFSPSEEQIKNK